jgi:hypothetical protein
LTKTITRGATPSNWHPEALYLKAQRYAQHMANFDSDGWEYALWGSLSLELLARAALANISPALLADTDKSWSSLYHSLGFTPTEKKFVPKSIGTADVFKRLTAIITSFTTEHENFSILHTGRRNSELHSGELAFDGVKGSEWQPRFYETCKILLTSMGMSLEHFVGREEADVAQKLIQAAADDSAKAVRGDVEAHKKVWLSKDPDDQATLGASAAVWATRQAGHRVDCPACSSQALVIGEPVSAPVQRLNSGRSPRHRSIYLTGSNA